MRRMRSFIFTSTNKVYGDLPNRLPLIEGRGGLRSIRTIPMPPGFRRR